MILMGENDMNNPLMVAFAENPSPIRMGLFIERFVADAMSKGVDEQRQALDYASDFVANLCFDWNLIYNFDAFISHKMWPVLDGAPACASLYDAGLDFLYRSKDVPEQHVRETLKKLGQYGKDLQANARTKQQVCLSKEDCIQILKDFNMLLPMKKIMTDQKAYPMSIVIMPIADPKQEEMSDDGVMPYMIPYNRKDDLAYIIELYPHKPIQQPATFGLYNAICEYLLLDFPKSLLGDLQLLCRDLNIQYDQEYPDDMYAEIAHVFAAVMALSGRFKSRNQTYLQNNFSQDVLMNGVNAWFNYCRAIRHYLKDDSI